ncbi:MAG: recombination and repair protein RecO [Myxococcaceae bacterium]|nr:recombination and repair protein RecO [Myxococcaceae bacterium]
MTEHSARAFVLDRRPHREQDLRVTLLTEHGARVDPIALNGQRSTRRFMGGLTPLALYRVRYTVSARGARLDEAVVDRVWPALARGLRSQTAALAATGIVRAVAEPTPHDGALFLLLGELYTAAAASDDRDALAARLVRFAFEVLDHTGHAIALDRCVRCDAPAPDNARVTLDPHLGGLVCRQCGGGPYAMSAADRADLRAVRAGDYARGRAEMLRWTARIIEGVSVDAAGSIATVVDHFDPR